MEYFPYILIGIFLTAFLLNPLTTLLHELGHAAIPLLARIKTDIYIGSYGDSARSIHLKLGLLGIWISYDPLKWNRGLCKTEKELPFSLQVLSILAGPVVSFLLGAAATFIALAFDAHGAIKLLLVIFTTCTVIDLWINLRPGTRSYALYGGGLLYNDGQRIKELFRYRRDEKISELAEKGDYAEAEKRVMKALKRRSTDEYILRMMVVIKIRREQYEEAFTFYGKLAALHTLNAHDHVMQAHLLGLLERNEEALKAYDTALEKEPDHALANNNRGYHFLFEERFAEALPYLERAVAADPAMAYAYNNLGHAKLKTGKAEDGLEDILHSLQLDATNSFAHRNLGIYHLDKGDAAEALIHFRKAEEIDKETPMLPELIGQAENVLKSSPR